MPIAPIDLGQRARKKPSARLVYGLLEAAFLFAAFAGVICILAGLRQFFF